MIVEERPPCLGWWLAVTDHVLGDGRLGDADPEQLEFPMHTRRAPQRILARELTDQIADLPGNPRSCGNPAAARFPRPVETEPALVPADQGVRAEYDERGSAFGPDPIQPHPEETLATARPEPSAISCGDHRTLLTKGQDFQVQEASTPDKTGHRREHRGEERLHPKDATALERKKSTKSSSTEFLVGTALACHLPQTSRHAVNSDGLIW
jgi:hypothetical protein